MGTCPSKPESTPPPPPPPPEPTPSTEKPTCNFKKGDRVKRLGNPPNYGKLGTVTSVTYTDRICNNVLVSYEDGTTEGMSPTYFKLLSREKCPWKVNDRVQHKTLMYMGTITAINFLNENEEEQDDCQTVKVKRDNTNIEEDVNPSELTNLTSTIGSFPKKPTIPPPNTQCKPTVKRWLGTVKDTTNITYDEFKEILKKVSLEDLKECITYFETYEGIQFKKESIPTVDIEKTKCETKYPDIYALLKTGEFEGQSMVDIIDGEDTDIQKRLFARLDYNVSAGTLKSVDLMSLMEECNPAEEALDQKDTIGKILDTLVALSKKSLAVKRGGKRRTYRKKGGKRRKTSKRR